MGGWLSCGACPGAILFSRWSLGDACGVTERSIRTQGRTGDRDARQGSLAVTVCIPRAGAARPDAWGSNDVFFSAAKVAAGTTLANAYLRWGFQAGRLGSQRWFSCLF